MKNFKAGFVAIIGRPNVGKSTLLNHFVGVKISITSRKPQTTRHRILGIKTDADTQLIFVDTPGIHVHAGRALNRLMNKAALSVLQEVDVIIWMVDARVWTEGDNYVLKYLQYVKAPVILAVNKIDRLKDKKTLLPFLQAAAIHYPFFKIIPISAKNSDQLHALLDIVRTALPEQPPFFPADQVTDRSDQFIAAELVREKLTRLLGQELPYALAVTIDAYEDREDIALISAIIWVDKNSQKPIVVGEKGELLKQVGQKARLDLEKYLEKKVFLKLWVKVKSGWQDNEKWLHQLGGYENS